MSRAQFLRIYVIDNTQIRRQADKLLPKRLQDADGEPLNRGAVSHLTGPEPELAGHTSVNEEARGLAKWLEQCRDAGIPLHQVAVFARSEALLKERGLPALEQVGSEAAPLDGDGSPSEGTTNVGTMHRAKGLEFRAVAVIGCDAANIPSPHRLAKLHDPADRENYLEQERNLLYVACTRARERLMVSWVGDASAAFQGRR